MPSNRTARTIRLPDDLWDRLVDEAKYQKRSVNNLVEVMLENGLDLDPFMDNLAAKK